MHLAHSTPTAAKKPDGNLLFKSSLAERRKARFFANCGVGDD
jgi:hypothetical protein